MSSAASTSGSVNGRVPTSNGSAHGEKTIDSAYEANGVSSPSSSSFPGNGFTRFVLFGGKRRFSDELSSPPFPNAHNEEIIDHLYQAGFQTGVCPSVSMRHVCTDVHSIALRGYEPGT